jgi:5-methylcytosine-specific restriction enzyme subunit McrC
MTQFWHPTRHEGRVVAQSRHYLDEAGRAVLKPDIVWRVGSKVAAVVDAKYKAEKPSGFPNADLYQLLAYCTVLGLRVGHLVYAAGTSSRPATSSARRARKSSATRWISASRRPGSSWG